VNDHAARALKQGLDDDGGDFVGAFGQQVFQLLDALDMAGFALQADGGNDSNRPNEPDAPDTAWTGTAA